MARHFPVVAVDVDGSIFIMMLDRSVCNCNVGIHFDSFQVGSDRAAQFMLGVYSVQFSS